MEIGNNSTVIPLPDFDMHMLESATSLPGLDFVPSESLAGLADGASLLSMLCVFHQKNLKMKKT